MNVKNLYCDECKKTTKHKILTIDPIVYNKKSYKKCCTCYLIKECK